MYDLAGIVGFPQPVGDVDDGSVTAATVYCLGRENGRWVRWLCEACEDQVRRVLANYLVLKVPGDQSLMMSRAKVTSPVRRASRLGTRPLEQRSVTADTEMVLL